MYKKILKRMIDFLFSLFLLIPCTLIIMVFGALIIFEDHGPILYKSKRLGKNMVPFTMYKMRTMKMNAPDIRNDDGSTFNSRVDSRVTKIGSILRYTSLDEIPQIFNVLMGNMSFIGPRPELEEQAQYYIIDELLSKEKFNVLPGLSGLAQVNGRNTLTWHEKNRFDCIYAKDVSLGVDFSIFLRTIAIVFTKKGINKHE